jgi:hypothetical protein
MKAGIAELEVYFVAEFLRFYLGSLARMVGAGEQHTCGKGVHHHTLFRIYAGQQNVSILNITTNRSASAPPSRLQNTPHNAHKNEGMKNASEHHTQIGDAIDQAQLQDCLLQRVFILTEARVRINISS